MLKNFKKFNEHKRHEFDENFAQFHLNKYAMLSPEDIQGDKEKVIDYFTSLYGDNFSLVKVASYKDLGEYCDNIGVTKEFVLTTIKDHLKI
tara:strand:+ start:6340 stop:6612 length:273 start_codon:yes stop_codon:yes gene_type:complete